MPTTVANKAREAFSSRLKHLRRAAGFRSARAFASSLGIDENRYTRYERAEVEPSFSLFVTMCEALSVTPNELLGFEPAAFSQPATDGVLAPGFFEAAAQRAYEGESTGQPTRDPMTAAPGTPDAAPPIRAAAWRLAQLIVTHCRSDETTAIADELGTMKAISIHYNAILIDPFGYASRLFSASNVSGIDPAVSAEIVQSLKTITTAALEQAASEITER